MQALLMKELKDFFYTPLFYIISALTLFLAGFLFYHYLDPIEVITAEQATVQLWRPLLGNLNFLMLFIVPLLAMNKMSLEYKNKTLTLLRLSALSHTEIVLSKILATWLALILLMIVVLSIPFALLLYLEVPIMELCVGFLGLSLSALSLSSIGVWGSSLTRHPVIAACFSFTVSFAFVVIFLTGQMAHNPLVGEILQYLAIPLHFAPFAAGTIRSFDVAYFLSFVVLLPYLTIRRIAKVAL